MSARVRGTTNARALTSDEWSQRALTTSAHDEHSWAIALERSWALVVDQKIANSDRSWPTLFLTRVLVIVQRCYPLHTSHAAVPVRISVMKCPVKYRLTSSWPRARRECLLGGRCPPQHIKCILTSSESGGASARDGRRPSSAYERRSSATSAQPTLIWARQYWFQRSGVIF